MSGVTPNTESVLDYLVGRLEPGFNPQRFADLLDTLVWCTDDNGGQILDVRRRWLLGGDELRTRIALSMTDTFPGRSRDEVIAVLDVATRRFPELRSKADEIIASWDEAGYPDGGGDDVDADVDVGVGAGVESAAIGSSIAGLAMADALGFFADHSASNMQPVHLAEVFDDLAALLVPDTAAELYAVRDAWLAGDDEWRTALALRMETNGRAESEAP